MLQTFRFSSHQRYSGHYPPSYKGLINPPLHVEIILLPQLLGVSTMPQLVGKKIGPIGYGLMGDCSQRGGLTVHIANLD